MSFWADLAGTTEPSFIIELGGVRLKNDAGHLAVRSNADDADAELTTSKVNVSGEQLVLNSDAAGAGADWSLTLARPTSGMTANVVLTLPPDDGTPGQVLQTDGAGALSWITVAGGTLGDTLTALDATDWAANAVPVGTGVNTLTQMALAANTFLARSSAGDVAAKPISDDALALLAAADDAAMRAELGLGTMATQNASSVAITGGSAFLSWAELGLTGSVNTPFLDFHTGSGAPDFGARIIASGGTASNGSSTLNITAGSLTWNGASLNSLYQASDAELAAIAGLVSAADRLPYFTGAGTAALATFTGFGRSLVDDADAAAGRVTLGLGTMATQDAGSVNIIGGAATGMTALSGTTITATAGNLVVTSTVAGNPETFRVGSSGANTVMEIGRRDSPGTSSVSVIDFHTGAVDVDHDTRILASAGSGVSGGGVLDLVASTLRWSGTNMGSMVFQNATGVAITGGSISGITDLAVADGGTGASTAAGARTNLGLGTLATQDASSVAITGGSITGVSLSAPALTLTVAGNSWIEMGRTDGVASTPFIDFHSGATAVDRDARIIASGGTGVSGQGTLAIEAGTVQVTGELLLGTALAVAEGGTGATTAASARSNLGLGTMATQNANAVSITGGDVAAATLSVTGRAQLSSGYSAATVNWDYQGGITTKSAAATLTGAEILTRVIRYTGAAANLTTPTAANLDTASGMDQTARCIDFWVINTGSGTATIVANTGITAVGALTVPAGTSAAFRLRRDGAAAYVLLRL